MDRNIVLLDLQSVTRVEEEFGWKRFIPKCREEVKVDISVLIKPRSLDMTRPYSSSVVMVVLTLFDVTSSDVEQSSYLYSAKMAVLYSKGSLRE